MGMTSYPAVLKIGYHNGDVVYIVEAEGLPKTFTIPLQRISKFKRLAIYSKGGND